ncbi:MAG: NAD(P)-dependent glycerol-1-phosphate dehydrogenase [Thermoplasmatota archaeon]
MPDFKKAKAMVFPRRVVAGYNVIDQIADMARDFGLKGAALIVTGPQTLKIAGKPVADYLKDSGYDVRIHETGPATMENVDGVVRATEEVKASFIVGAGGGSKIDLAKAAAHRLYLPFISVPTSASHDGLASPKASIKDQGASTSVDAVMPIGILADIHIISKAPYRYLASGCADLISNTTALLDWQLAARLRGEEFSSTAHAISRMAAETILEATDIIKKNLVESVWVAIKPMISSGLSMSIAGSSRPTSGSEHLFSHALDRLAPGRALHGEQCGVGTIMMMYLHGGDWERVHSALKEIGAPVTAAQLNVSREEVIRALTVAHTIRPERYTILGDRGLSAEAAEKVATLTEVI